MAHDTNDREEEFAIDQVNQPAQAESTESLFERANRQNAIDAERSGYGNNVRAYIQSLGATWH
ncbi:MAG: hypothetical protein AAB836_01590 [Patescibacteria group bacterium]|mgnify:CR=1 FL=1